MANLEIEFCGVRFRNPIWIASSSLTGTIERLRLAEEVGAGGVVTKLTITGTPPDNHYYRSVVLKEGWACFGDKRLNLEEGTALVRQAKRDLTIPVIANFMGNGFDLDDWANLARHLERAGADMLEIDLSCPNVELSRDLIPSFPGIAIGQRPDLSSQITAAVKSAVRIPVLAKMTPEAPDLVAVAEACVAAGADAITAINAYIGMPGVDIQRGGRPLYNGMENQPYSAITGNWIRPFGMRYVSQVAQTTPVPVSGVGGISTWQDILQYLMLGATSTQMCSSIFLKGFQVVTKAVKGLHTYMEAHPEYSSLADLRGQGLEYIVPRKQMQHRDLVARINEDQCTGCEKCVREIGDCFALDMQGRLAVVTEEKCIGCNICAWICPPKAIDMVPR